jgi:hypothetical protein
MDPGAVEEITSIASQRSRRKLLRVLAMGTAALAVPGGTVFCPGGQQSSNQALPEKGRKEGTLPVYSHVFWTQSQQQIDGFGISGAFHQAHNLMSYPKSDVTRVTCPPKTDPGKM